jgi:hypothetical protein
MDMNFIYVNHCICLYKLTPYPAKFSSINSRLWGQETLINIYKDFAKRSLFIYSKDQYYNPTRRTHYS